jgi:hypothetical protein
VGNGDGAQSAEHVKRLREDFKAYASASQAITDAIALDPQLQARGCLCLYIYV